MASSNGEKEGVEREAVRSEGSAAEGKNGRHMKEDGAGDPRTAAPQSRTPPPDQSPTSSNGYESHPVSSYPYQHSSGVPLSPSMGGNPPAAYDVRVGAIPPPSMGHPPTAPMESPYPRQQFYQSHPIPHSPVSPAHTSVSNGTTRASASAIPPASPLYQGSTPPAYIAEHLEHSALLQRAGPSPSAGSIPYLPTSPAAVPSYGGGYAGFSAAPAYVSASSRDSPSTASEQSQGWHEIQNMQGVPSNSFHMNSMGAHMAYPSSSHRARTNSNRSHSFEEHMLPPSTLDGSDHGAPMYYGGPDAMQAGAYVTHQQAWGYGQPMYPGTPMRHHVQGRHHHVDHTHSQLQQNHQQRHLSYPQMPYYPAVTPGPPIQTTPSNKGPDGANLFIFHIPNSFTNRDMYELFSPYGNLLSVRIMVEKDTGRSRGFGFVSYDSPDSAALAIKELNGCAVGNKRLKVQHKQIRTSDHRHSSSHGMPRGDVSVGGGRYSTTTFDGMPPSSSFILSSPASDTRQQGEQPAEVMPAGSAGQRSSFEDDGYRNQEKENTSKKDEGKDGRDHNNSEDSSDAAFASEGGGIHASSTGGAGSSNGTSNPGGSPLNRLDAMRNALPDFSG